MFPIPRRLPRYIYTDLESKGLDNQGEYVLESMLVNKDFIS